MDFFTETVTIPLWLLCALGGVAFGWFLGVLTDYFFPRW